MRTVCLDGKHKYIVYFLCTSENSMDLSANPIKHKKAANRICHSASFIHQ